MSEQIAFKMQLCPGFEAEYRKRHDAIWPELVRLLKEAGISDYSIFLDVRRRHCLPCCGGVPITPWIACRRPKSCSARGR
jgi:hypothetical protein